MASTYLNDLRLNELGTGDAAGTWGTITNTNLELIGEGLSYATEDCFTSDADATATVADGATDPARAMYFKVTSSATLTATRTLTIAPNDMSRLQFIENATTGSQSINISQGSGSNVTIPNGQTKAVYMDGAGATAAVVDAFSLLNLNLADNVKLNFGASDDLQIYHDGSDSFVTDAGTGSLKLCGTNLTLKNSADNKTYLFASDGGAVDLRYDNSAKIATTNTGVDITGNATFSDNDKAIFGDGSDLEIYHDGSNSYIQDTGTGSLVLEGQDLYLNSTAGTYLRGVEGGAVTIFHNDSTKFTTTSHGISVTGSAIASTQTAGTVTGTTTADFDTYQNFVWTLTGNVTLDNPSTEKVGQSGFITFIQDGTGGRTVTLGTDYETAGGAGLTLSSAASATDVVPYIVVASNRILLGTPQLAFS
jgi:hypothetical protein